MAPKNQQSNKPNKRKHAPAAKPDAPDRPTSKRPKLAAPKRSGPPTTTKRSDKPFKPKFQKSEPDTVKKAPLSKRERRINAKVNPSLFFFFFFWVSVFSWIFFINQSLRKKNKEEVYFLVLLISVIVKQYVDVIWWMGIEFGLLKVDLFIYFGFWFFWGYCILQELAEARKKKRKPYYELEHVGFIYLVMFVIELLN